MLGCGCIWFVVADGGRIPVGRSNGFTSQSKYMTTDIAIREEAKTNKVTMTTKNSQKLSQIASSVLV